MATMNLVLLSSPSKPHHHAPLAILSSPVDFPSPSALFTSKPKLRMPSIGTKRMSTTPTQTSLEAEKSAHDDIWDVPDDDPPAKAAAIKPAPKTRGRPKKEVVATVDHNAEGGEPSKKKRGRPKKVAAESDDVTVLKEKAPRKPRLKKVDENGQTKIAKGRVTKASSVSATPNVKKTETVSSHFAAAPGDSVDVGVTQNEQVLELEKAGERRMNWTPAKEGRHSSCQMEYYSQDQLHDTPVAAQGFGNLLDTYGYAQTARSTSTSTIEENKPARKRKLIELVKTSHTTSKASAAKPKAVRKKARTITDMATAEFAAPIEEGKESALMHQFFTREDSGVDPSGAPRTKVTKLFKKPGKGKKAANPPMELLLPQAALDHARRQEFIFGTSSQLARDDDPAFLRDLQQAMQLSNQYDVEDPFAEPLPSNPSKDSSKLSLLEAATLIEKDGAREIDVLDLSRSSQAEAHFAREATPPATVEAETSQHLPLTAEPDGDWIVLDDTPLPAQASQRPLSIPRASSPSPLVQAYPARSQTVQKSHPTPPEPDALKPASPTSARTNILAKPPAEQCPDYDSYSTADLTKEIAKYKFKPIKKREDMVSLLQKCWEGKQKQAQGVLSAIPKPVAAPSSSSQIRAPPPAPSSETAALPPRKRGRPREGESRTASMRKLDGKPLPSTRPIAGAPSGSALAFSTPKRGRGRPRKVLPIPEDISDVEGPPTPSPPRIRASQLRSPPALEIVQESDGEADATLMPLSPSSQERELFAAVSKAITMQPRSIDSKKLSWYEKILLYDPILLEDLTKWLNEEGLGKVGYDGEVMPLQVKSWCMRKSICCLFKESKRNRGVGGVKKIGRE